VDGLFRGVFGGVDYVKKGGGGIDWSGEFGHCVGVPGFAFRRALGEVLEHCFMFSMSWLMTSLRRSNSPWKLPPY
jgi:hypothetical protein